MRRKRRLVVFVVAVGVAAGACASEPTADKPSSRESARAHAASGCDSALDGQLSEVALNEFARAARDDPTWDALYRAYSEAFSGDLDLSGIPASPVVTHDGGSPWSAWRLNDASARTEARWQQLAKTVTDECRKATVQ